ncbi:MAG TPA: hypothetical protein VF040_18435 [Ktedonobacterales bacterium]
MIVRVMTENQYRLSDDEAAELDRLDDPLYEAIQSGDDLSFALALEKVIAFVHEKGEVVPVDEIVPSDIIVPAPDMTVAEARQYLQQADALATKTPPAEPAAKSGE